VGRGVESCYARASLLGIGKQKLPETSQLLECLCDAQKQHLLDHLQLRPPLKLRGPACKQQVRYCDFSQGKGRDVVVTVGAKSATFADLIAAILSFAGSKDHCPFGWASGSTWGLGYWQTIFLTGEETLFYFISWYGQIFLTFKGLAKDLTSILQSYKGSSPIALSVMK